MQRRPTRQLPRLRRRPQAMRSRRCRSARPIPRPSTNSTRKSTRCSGSGRPNRTLRGALGSEYREKALGILNLEGGCNFRDLGGYRTRDGRMLKRGCVFRTGVLSYFTPADHERLNQLGVRAICDLRRVEEREREPTRWPDAATQHLSWEDGTAPPTIRSVAANHSHPYTAAGMHAA